MSTDGETQVSETPVPKDGDVLHPDQTIKQPVIWRCSNPDCLETDEDGNTPHFFDFERDQPVCPKCTLKGFPFVTKRTLIHLLVKDPQGKIKGQFGRYHIACDKGRIHLATPNNGEACSDILQVVNCPGCLTFVGDKFLGIQGAAITEDAKGLPFKFIAQMKE